MAMNNQTEQADRRETPQEQRKDILRRWAGLLACTLVLIGCGFLAGKAIERVVTVKTEYKQTVTIDIQDLYGTWRFAEVAHQWAGSERTLQGTQELMKGTVYGITEDSFLAAGGQEWVIENPQYILHALGEPTGAFDDVKAWLGDEVLGYYTVLSEGGTVQPYRIYFSLETYWVAEFSDATADGSIILYDIYRLEKSE